jgi:hypothetical protein
MIEAVEAVMQHWGESVRRGGDGGGLASPAGTLVEWKGCPPRTGSSGSRVLVAGAGPDFLSSEVEAALAAIERMPEGAGAVRLALRRYVFVPLLTVDEQVRDLQLGLGAAGQQAYFRLLHRLHELVKAELTLRRELVLAMHRESKKAGDRTRKSAVRLAGRAHAARVKELYCGNGLNHSSGDSAPVGAGAPRQVPVRNNR